MPWDLFWHTYSQYKTFCIGQLIYHWTICFQTPQCQQLMEQRIAILLHWLVTPILILLICFEENTWLCLTMVSFQRLDISLTVPIGPSLYAENLQTLVLCYTLTNNPTLVSGNLETSVLVVWILNRWALGPGSKGAAIFLTQTYKNLEWETPGCIQKT